MKNIKSFLPVFQGFYGTIFEYDNEEQDIEHAIEEEGAPKDSNWDNFTWDYKEYHKRIAKACCTMVGGELTDLGISVTYEGLSSPREYNFTNDSINVTYGLKKDSVDKIVQYLKDNVLLFGEYLAGKFTSYSGFISFYSNSSDVWIQDIIPNKIENDFNVLGVLLEFYLQNEEYTAEDLREELHDENWINYELKTVEV